MRDKSCRALTSQTDGVEFFVHSPFAKHADGDTVLRNESAIILHATFEVSDRKTRYPDGGRFDLGDS